MHNELDRKIYSDQTGQFPVTLFHGNRYIMVLLKLDRNNILSELTINRTAEEIMIYYQKLIDLLKEKGIQPKLNLLDNECSEEFKEIIKKEWYGIKTCATL